MIKKMEDVSKKCGKAVEHEKTIGNAFPTKKMGQVDELLVFFPKTSPTAMPGTRFFFLGVKTGPSSVSLFCVRIKHFELKDMNSN